LPDPPIATKNSLISSESKEGQEKNPALKGNCSMEVSHSVERENRWAIICREKKSQLYRIIIYFM